MLLVDTFTLRERSDRLDTGIAVRAKQDEGAQQLMSIPGIDPMIATTIQALAPPVSTFFSRHDFAAWVGLFSIRNRPAARLGSGE